ncbi:DUF4136 domain-containing protein [Pelagicoccus sp. SDUM812005]|uniref:DUF4136 domain-containing protein n=1 Tax=Pelagicoccus sp. SDUM812005 TaxID=3041257 RepID=UPI00280D5332|nr:DUF4136 domain-containing protein [Pelagicoccus sp. SDUM812005]MDQ8182621.1 DUF4136 domain-containing protein [Pelagicoccus sp. SDUM812005]
MKKQITLLATTAALVLSLSGCASSRAVRSESNLSDTVLYQNETYALEISDPGKRSVAFSPSEQSEAKRTLQLALESKGLAPAANAAKSDYLVRFDTYIETEPDSFAATFPQRDVYVHSHTRGISTPLGTVPTGRDTHVVERGYSVTAGGGEHSQRYFVVDVVDPRSQEILWRGYTRRGSDRLDAKRLTQEIEKIVEKLPVRKKPVESDELI